MALAVPPPVVGACTATPRPLTMMLPWAITWAALCTLAPEPDKMIEPEPVAIVLAWVDAPAPDSAG